MSCSVASSEYLNELLSDKTTVSKMPKIFLHAERLLDQEISRVRNELFHGVVKSEPDGFGDLQLPTPVGPRIKLSEKVYAPVKEYPKFNFVGRVIGPRGMTLREVELATGSKLLVRGKGSMKDKKLEEEKRGQPNYDHLEEDLHVLITVDDTEERAKLRLAKAVERVKELLKPVDDGEDELKKKQLKDLAMMNGTLRDQAADLLTGNTAVLHNGLLGMPLTPTIASYPFAARPPVPGAYPAALSGLEFNPYATRPGTIFDYHGLETSILGAVKPRRPIREHPYQR